MGSKGNTEAGRILVLSVTSGVTFLFKKPPLCILFANDSLQLLRIYMEEEEACYLPANLYLRDF